MTASPTAPLSLEPTRRTRSTRTRARCASSAPSALLRTSRQWGPPPSNEIRPHGPRSVMGHRCRRAKPPDGPLFHDRPAERCLRLQRGSLPRRWSHAWAYFGLLHRRQLPPLVWTHQGAQCGRSDLHRCGRALHRAHQPDNRNIPIRGRDIMLSGTSEQQATDNISRLPARTAIERALSARSGMVQT